MKSWFFWKLEALVIILTWYVKSNETMAKISSKGQCWFLTFQLRSLILESHQYIKTVFSQTIGPIELKFHVKTSYDKLAKTDTKHFGHMT